MYINLVSSNNLKVCFRQEFVDEEEYEELDAMDDLDIILSDQE